jgi:O-succinylbenzoic acid--CoA ligase
VNELSIVAAARDSGRRVALRLGARAYTFAEVAQLARERSGSLARDARERTPYPLVGESTLEAVVTLYALLELRVPALLLHPRLAGAERAALVALAARLGPIPHEDAAAVVFTSGTSGEPRGVVLTRTAFVASARASAANLGWRDDDCWLACMTTAHVGGLSILTRCLAARRAVALEPRFDAAMFAAWIDDHRATLASVVPTMLARALDANPTWNAPAHLRAILVGGAAAPAPLLARAAERRLPLVTTYGSTETCSHVAATRYDNRYALRDDAAGEPLPGVEIRVVDGRIHVRGAMLMAGYWDAPALAPHAWFDTGDAGFLDARGALHVLGRGCDVIVTGGENVHPAEVERVLQSVPGVAAAGVFGVADDVWGETVAAALVIEGEAPSDAALVAHVDARLARYKRPRRVCIVGALPQTRAGKLDRDALRALAPALRPLRRPAERLV